MVKFSLFYIISHPTDTIYLKQQNKQTYKGKT